MIKTNLIWVAILVIFFSCNKEGKSNGSDQGIETEAGKASYGLGVNYGDGFKQQGLTEEQIEVMMQAIEDYNKLSTDNDRKAYQIGIQLAEQMKTAGLDSEFNMDLVKAGMTDGLKGEKNLKVSKEQIPQIIEAFVNKKREEKSKNNLTASNKYLSENGSKSGVKKTASGLQYKVEKEGDGKTKVINPYDTVYVKYKGTLIDGKEFDNSEKNNNGKPVPFVAGQNIPGFAEGLKLMSKGGKYTLYIPPSLGYGDSPQVPPTIGPNQALIFEVELVDVKKGTPPQAQPQGQGGQPIDPRIQQQIQQQMQQQQHAGH